MSMLSRKSNDLWGILRLFAPKYSAIIWESEYYINIIYFM